MSSSYRFTEPEMKALRDDAAQLVLKHSYFKMSIHSAKSLMNSICEMIEMQSGLAIERENAKKEVEQEVRVNGVS